MHNLEESAKTILDEFERTLLKDMKVFIGKLFYETTENSAPKFIYPKVVQEIYISQEDEVYIRDQNGNLHKFDSVTFLKKVA